MYVGVDGCICVCVQMVKTIVFKTTGFQKKLTGQNTKTIEW